MLLAENKELILQESQPAGCLLVNLPGVCANILLQNKHSPKAIMVFIIGVNLYRLAVAVS